MKAGTIVDPEGAGPMIQPSGAGPMAESHGISMVDEASLAVSDFRIQGQIAPDGSEHGGTMKARIAFEPSGLMKTGILFVPGG